MALGITDHAWSVAELAKGGDGGSADHGSAAFWSLPSNQGGLPQGGRVAMRMIYFEDLTVGDSWTSSEHVVNDTEMLAYNQQNDPWPMHVDPEAAAKLPYGGVIASGGYTISLMYRLGHEIYNRADLKWAFLGGFDWHLKFVEPVRAGDRLHERITVLETRPSSKPGRGISKIRMELLNDHRRVVLSVDSTGLMATRPAVGGPGVPT